MDNVTLNAYAKINISLDVLGKRPDGYHDIKMIMQTVDLCDIVKLEKNGNQIVVKTDCDELIHMESNLAYKAAQLFYETCGIPKTEGVEIHIGKNIPIGAGLAGGSSDAAAIINGLDLIFNQNLSLEKKMEIGLKIGADVPFCIMGGTALAEGIGEILTPLPGFMECYVVLVKPSIHISTPVIYGMIDRKPPGKKPDTELIIRGLNNRNFEDIVKGMYNVMEEVTVEICPEVQLFKDLLLIKYDSIAASMSGSGPTVYGFFENENDAVKAYEGLKAVTKQVFLSKIVNRP